MKNRFAPCFVLSLVLLASSRGLAQSETPPPEPATDNVQQARERFQRGAELYKEGSFDAAFAEFSRAYEIAPNYRVLFNLGQVELERHDYASAMRFFQRYLEDGGAEVDAERRAEVEREILALKNRVAELTVTSNVTGVEVSIDGTVVGTLPLSAPVLVSAGVRRIAARRDGYQPIDRTLKVAGGDKPVLELELEPVQSATPVTAPTSAAADSSGGVPAGAWIGFVAAGVFGGTAVTFGILTQKKDEDLDRELSKYPADLQKIDDERSRLKLYAGLTDGFAGAALLSAVVGTYFAFSGSSEPATESARTKQTRTRLVPLGNGIALAGEF
jgi:tetratricopeptide (TPR) repeat protein